MVTGTAEEPAMPLEGMELWLENGRFRRKTAESSERWRKSLADNRVASGR
jgi:hypothetical protein